MCTTSSSRRSFHPCRNSLTHVSVWSRWNCKSTRTEAPFNSIGRTNNGNELTPPLTPFHLFTERRASSSAAAMLCAPSLPMRHGWMDDWLLDWGGYCRPTWLRTPIKSISGVVHTVQASVFVPGKKCTLAICARQGKALSKVRFISY
jgi:hypothetical protein